MAQTFRISLPTYNALTDSDPRHYSLFADSDNVLIKEHSRGSASVSNGGTEEVDHGLGYLPHFFAYTEMSSGRYRLTNGYNIYLGWKTWVDTSTLYINNNSGQEAGTKYFVFYDDIE